MPNWCQNTLTLLHTDPVLIQRAKDAFNRGELCSEFVPIPEEEKENWYNWSVENWGTKWDIGKGDMDDREGGVFFVFESAWAPPVAFYEKLEELGFHITAYYFEPGVGFCGRWTSDDGDDIYEFDEDANAEWVRENIPVDIDTTFGISDIMQDDEDYESQDVEEPIPLEVPFSTTKEVKKYPNGEYYIEFSDEEMKAVGWSPEDTLKWTDNGDGSWTLKKIS